MSTDMPTQPFQSACSRRRAPTLTQQVVDGRPDAQSVRTKPIASAEGIERGSKGVGEHPLMHHLTRGIGRIRAEMLDGRRVV
jgi:hypothetical protein